MIFRNSARYFLRFCFSSYEQSFDKYATLKTVNTTKFNVNKEVTFHGIPQPSEQIMAQLAQIASEQNENAKVLILSDCSKNMAINMKYTEDVFKKIIYKNIQQEGLNILLRNPEIPEELQECSLISKFVLQDLLKDQQQQQLQIDSQTFDNLSQKMEEDYGMDLVFAIPTLISLCNGSDVYIVGLSQLLMRRSLANSYSLPVIKQSFMKLAEIQKQLDSTGTLDQGALNVVLNQQLAQFFPEVIIGKQAEQLYYFLHHIEEECIVYGKTPVQDRLEQLLALTSPEMKIQVRNLKKLGQFLGAPEGVDDCTDQVLIQKHAILQVILRTSVWTKPYILNMFPYLKEEYQKLLPEEQSTIKQRYLHHFNRYSSAWQKLTN